MKGLRNLLIATAFVAASIVGGCQSPSNSKTSTGGTGGVNPPVDTVCEYDSTILATDENCVKPVKTIPSIEYSCLEDGDENTEVSCTETATNEDGGAIYFFKEGIPWASIDTAGKWTGTRPKVEEDTIESVTVYACNKDFGVAEKRKSLTQIIGDTKISFNLKNQVPNYADNCSSFTKEITTYDVGGTGGGDTTGDGGTGGTDGGTDGGTGGDATGDGGIGGTDGGDATGDGGTDPVIPVCEYDSKILETNPECVTPVDPVVNVAPVINGINFDASANARAVGNKVSVPWGRDILGSIEATDENGDPLSYNSGIVSGTDLYSNYQNDKNFSITAYQQSITDDATADLGTAFFEACNANLCEKIHVGFIGRHPIEANLTPEFYEDGTVRWYSDATSDGSFLKKVTAWFNTALPGSSNTGDVYSKGASIFGNIANGTNTGKFSWENNAGDVRTVEGSFVPASESEARAKIEEILDANGITAGVSTEKPTGYEQDTIIMGVRVDYAINYENKWATINFTSFDDNLTTELNNYDILKTGSTANDLQMSGFPLYEVISRTQAFANNGFIDVE